MEMKQGKTTEKQRLAYWLWPVLIFLVALGVRIVSFTLSPMFSRDGIFYVETLRRVVAEGNGVLSANVLANIPPLFLLCGKALVGCGLPAEMALLALSLFCGAALPATCYFIFRYFVPENEMPVEAALLFAVFPPLVKASADLLREPLFLSLIALAFCLFLYARRYCGRKRFLVVFFASFCAWGAIFVRVEGVMVFLLLAAFFFCFSLRSKMFWRDLPAWILGMGSLTVMLLAAFPPFMLYRFVLLRIGAFAFYCCGHGNPLSRFLLES